MIWRGVKSNFFSIDVWQFIIEINRNPVSSLKEIDYWGFFFFFKGKNVPFKNGQFLG
jgi:hypothetical protein